MRLVFRFVIKVGAVNVVVADERENQAGAFVFVLEEAVLDVLGDGELGRAVGAVAGALAQPARAELVHRSARTLLQLTCLQ